MQLNRAVSKRLNDLLTERNLSQNALSSRCGVSSSAINNIIRCVYPSVNLRIIHEICQGLDVSIPEFFDSPLFLNENLDP